MQTAPHAIFQMKKPVQKNSHVSQGKAGVPPFQLSISLKALHGGADPSQMRPNTNQRAKHTDTKREQQSRECAKWASKRSAIGTALDFEGIHNNLTVLRKDAQHSAVSQEANGQDGERLQQKEPDQLGLDEDRKYNDLAREHQTRDGSSGGV
eukprot:CAMPEP_0177396376 /NCGR_PEP_ID=MMETSP0368-20130122/56685_1 /TAXON_ID=447022 ORGANISM="Scrippsiella hangoei-like, Strain SHHI-4" /NCGR_SAMPLE_ID=MMETSP0368 /ASSEMBLY_ACC=CAM_ASM_000363 /LENGTH=151 /DNA_ID=CAMNT_0018863089 /DNA_START=99 /DNA_END=551 /DNA_ORIENTATION=+